MRVQSTGSSLGSCAALALVLCVPGILRAADAIAPDPATSVMTDGPQSLLDSPRNKDALNRRVDRRMIDDIRQQLGRSLTDTTLGLSDLEGKSLRDVMQQKASVLKDNPQMLWALAHEAAVSGDPLYASSAATATPLDTKEPGRILPPSDLYDQATGPDGSIDKLKDYLDRNYGMDDSQVRALGVYLGFAQADSTGKPAPDSVLDDPLNVLKTIATPDPAGTAPGADTKGGLYIPGPDLLRRMSSLLTLFDALQKGDDPLTARAADGRSLMDLLAELPKDGSPPIDPSQLKDMDRAALRSLVIRIARQMVQDDQAANKPLIESGQAGVTRLSRGSIRGLVGDTRRGFPTTGNGRIREINDKFYDTMIRSELKPSERDALELESEGDIFSIRGRPSDIKAKHYDPPIDPHDAFFGASMNLGGAAGNTGNP